MVIITPLHYDYKSIGKGNTFIEKYASILEYNKIRYRFLRFQNTSEYWNIIEKSSLFIARYRGIEKDLSLMHAVLPEIERKGIPTLPDFKTVYHCGDKLRLTTFYESNSIKQPQTSIFWEFDELMKWIEGNSLSFPYVAKLRRGAGSTNVIMVNSKKEVIRLGKKLLLKGVKSGMLEEAAYGNFFVLSLIKKVLLNPDKQNINDVKRKLYFILLRNLKDYESSCLLLQEFLPGNEGDTRITTIGNRAFGFRRFNRKNDFRASGSGSIDYNPNKIDAEMIKIAFDISQKFKFQTMAYDFVYDKNEKPVLLENNFTYVDSAVAKCPLFWKPNGETINNKNIFPQYWQLVDALKDENLRYPL